MKYRKIIGKKGAEKILSIYWFLILVIIAGGIFSMVYVFYGHPYDFRDLEARALTNQIADCISDGGQIKPSINISNINLLEDCNLNFNDLSYTEVQYYSRLELYNPDSQKISESSAGNSNLESSCELSSEDYKKLARCNTEQLYSTINGQGITIKILSIVRKSEKNTK